MVQCVPYPYHEEVCPDLSVFWDEYILGWEIGTTGYPLCLLHGIQYRLYKASDLVDCHMDYAG